MLRVVRHVLHLSKFEAPPQPTGRRRETPWGSGLATAR
jgi:hypothetical protein